MEDSVGEEERREQGETAAQAKAHREEVRETGAAGGGDLAEEGGFLSAVASRIGATMSSGANGTGGEADATAASVGEEGKRDANGEPGEEKGFLSSMATKFGAAMSGANGGSVDGGGGGDGNAAVASDGEDKKDGGDGGGGIFQKLMSSSPPSASPVPGAGVSETEEVKGEEKSQEAAGEQAGILSSMASRIGMAMSGANGDGNQSTEDAAKTSNGHAVDGSNGGEKGGEANGGGILNTMASKIGMAMSGANGDEDRGDAKASNGNAVDGRKDGEKSDEMNGGGILSAVASKIGMAVSGANGNGNHGAEDDAKTSNGDAVYGSNASKGEEEKNGHGAGIVEQIISNLPSDDQAPDSDEASLLISIIED